MEKHSTSNKIHYPSFWFLAIIILITLFGFTWPTIHPESYLKFQDIWWLDMIVHAGYYFFVAVVLFPLFRSRQKLSWLFFPLLLLLSWAFEIFQYYIPNRVFSFFDMISNFLGILFAAVFCAWGNRQIPHRTTKVQQQ